MRLLHLFSGRSSAVRTRAAPDGRRCLARSPHVVSTTHDAETVLLDLEHSQYHTLNEVGGRVWMLLAEPTTVDTIARAICGEYDAPLGQVEREVLALMAALDEAGLLTNGPPALTSS